MNRLLFLFLIGSTGPQLAMATTPAESDSSNVIGAGAPITKPKKRTSVSTVPTWLQSSQLTPLPKQAFIYCDVCTGMQYMVTDNPKPWSQVAVRSGDRVAAQLLNVNPFYKQTVKFEKASVAWRTPEPENFGWITLPKAPSAPEKVAAEKDVSKEVQVTETKISDKKSFLELANGRLEANRQPIKPADSKALELLRAILDAGVDIKTQADALFKGLRDTETTMSNTLGMLESVVGFQQNLTTSPCLTLSDYNKQEVKLNDALNAFFGQTVTDNSGSLSNAFRERLEVYPHQYNEVVRGFEQLRERLNTLKHEASLLTSPDRKTDALNHLNALEKLLDAYKKLLERDADAVKTFHDQLKGDEGKRIGRVCQTLLNNRTYFTTPVIQYPFTPDRNANEVFVKAIATRPIAKGDNEEITLLETSMPVVGGLQVAFSIGGLYTTLADRTYPVQTMPGSSTATPDTYIIRTNKSAGGIILATQAHAIWQTSPTFGWGANVGVGVDLLNDQRARYLLGMSLKMGGLSDNLLISFGASFGTIKRLSNEFDDTQTFKQKVDPKTFDRFGVGPYVGVSYILGSKKVK